MASHGRTRRRGIAALAALVIAIAAAALWSPTSATALTPAPGLSLSLDLKGHIVVAWNFDNGGSKRQTRVEIERKVEKVTDAVQPTFKHWRRRNSPSPIGASVDTTAIAGKGTFSYRARVTIRDVISPWSPILTLARGGGAPITTVPTTSATTTTAPTATDPTTTTTTDPDAPTTEPTTTLEPTSTTTIPGGGEWPLGPDQQLCAAGTTAALVQLVNEERIDARKAPLTEHPLLDRAARRHTVEMVTRNEFAHTFSDGTGPWEFFTWAGYTATVGLGQNLAAGQTTPAQVVSTWMQSRDHKSNMLSLGIAFTEIGVGCIVAPNGQIWWTADFG